MPATATAIPATAATAAATAALRLRTRFVDDKVPASKVLAVHGVDRAIRFFVVCDLDESESPRLTGETVTDQVDCRGIDTCL